MGLAQDGHDQRQDQGTGGRGEHEDRAPAEGVDQNAADRSRQHRPQDIGHRQVSHHLDQPVEVVEIAGDGARDHQAACRADTLNQPRANQRLDIGRDGACARAGDEQHQPAEQHRPPTEAVGQRPVDQRRDRHDEQRHAEGELGGRRVDSEIEPYRRNRRQIEMHRQRADRRHRRKRDDEHVAGRTLLAHEIILGPGGVCSVTPQSGDEIALDDFAERGLGKLVDDLDRLRHLIEREVGAAMRDQRRPIRLG